LCAQASLSREGSDDELRLERVWLKRDRYEALRFTVWRGGRFIPGPAHLTEPELIALLERGLEGGVFSDFFRRQLFLLVARQFSEEA
jgi:hypothetical protein